MRRWAWFALTGLLAVAMLGACGGGAPPGPAYRLHGLCFSPYLELDPNQGAVVSADRISSLLAVVAPYTDWVRTFGATHGLQHAPGIAKRMRLGVAAGCWLSRDQQANAAEVSALVQMIQAGQVDLAVVGSEVLLRQDLSEEQLLAYLRQIKAAGVPTTTNDTWHELLNHPAVMAECDVILANFYPYWEGVPVERAVRSIHANYSALAQAAGGKQVIVGETGWPSAGNAVGEAVPSPANASFFALNFVSWARAQNVAYFCFEAFDEPWKAAYEGPQGAHWGIWDSAGGLKPQMERIFRGETVPDNWSAGPLPGEPGIEFTYLPPYGSFDNLRGRVTGVDPAQHRVAVYIFVSGGWWTKPYWNQPLTSIGGDGTWSCDITTGGLDHLATSIAAYLVGADYSPPLMSGQPSLPAELDENAVAKAQAARSP